MGNRSNRFSSSLLRFIRTRSTTQLRLWLLPSFWHARWSLLSPTCNTSTVSKRSKLTARIIDALTSETRNPQLHAQFRIDIGDYYFSFSPSASQQHRIVFYSVLYVNYNIYTPERSRSSNFVVIVIYFLQKFSLQIFLQFFPHSLYFEFNYK